MWVVNFNPRSREGSDALNKQVNSFSKLFQSTLPRRERHQELRKILRMYIISIHAPAKGATTASRNLRFCQKISIHAPAKGATLIIAYAIYDNFNFNPRSREGSDEQSPDRLLVQPEISIHAPAKGATTVRITYLQSESYFNPRSREGSDTISL